MVGWLGPNDLHRAKHDVMSISAPCYFDSLRFRGLPSRSPVGRRLVGLSRFELLTPRLSSVCSNQLSYRPGILSARLNVSPVWRGSMPRLYSKNPAGSLKTR